MNNSNGQTTTQTAFVLENSFHIIQNAIYIHQNDKNYLIRNIGFEIIFDGLDDNDSVHILANIDERIHRKYIYPIIQEMIFGIGAAYAAYMDPSKQVLYVAGINNPSHNYFNNDRIGVNFNNRKQISFNEIVFDNTISSKIIYMIIYIDKNKNNMIEQNEIAYITLEIE